MSMCKAKANHIGRAPAFSISYKEVLRSTTGDLSHETSRGTECRGYGWKLLSAFVFVRGKSLIFKG